MDTAGTSVSTRLCHSGNRSGNRSLRTLARSSGRLARATVLGSRGLVATPWLGLRLVATSSAGRDVPSHLAACAATVEPMVIKVEGRITIHISVGCKDAGCEERGNEGFH